MLISQRVEGLIIASARKPGSMQPWKKLTATGIPFVLVDRRFPTVPFVGVDDERVGQLATEHLVNQGYRRIAHISGPQTTSTGIGRLKGYKRALRECGHTPNPDYLVQAHYHEENSGLKAMRSLLRLPSPPDAVFAASDPIAIGALQAMWQSGLRLPEDIGLIGVGNHRYSQYLRVPLSTIDQRRLEIGRSAVRLLLDLVDGKQRARDAMVMLEPELIIRSSSCRFESVEYGGRPGPAKNILA
jgi:LacI family transcriptional regulator